MRVEGASNTRKSFLASIIDPVVSSRPTDLEGVLHATRRISEGLRKTDIFASLDAYIDRPKDPLSESPDAIDLVFRTKERGRWYVSSSTELGNSEGSAVRPFIYLHVSFMVNSRAIECNNTYTKHIWRCRDL